MIIDRGIDCGAIYDRERRSATQIRSMAWDGDADAVIPHVFRYGRPPTDLVEP